MCKQIFLWALSTVHNTVIIMGAKQSVTQESKLSVQERNRLTSFLESRGSMVNSFDAQSIKVSNKLSKNTA